MAGMLVLGTLTACGGSDKDKDKDGAKTANAKIVLVLEDGTEVPYDISVKEGVSVRDGLFEAKLITEEEYGAMFVSNIDGHIADTMNDGVTWLPCDKDGNQLSAERTGEYYCFLDSILVNDGDEIYLKYYVVPNMD